MIKEVKKKKKFNNSIYQLIETSLRTLFNEVKKAKKKDYY